ncbi:TIGR01777 family oxidoreductase [Acinetobacter rathckeae]|uniref:TIGR01777 family oxidoreductase n=1 Tax=Acinetobacter rathckeae TaxID=2605272 RepID=UPI0018A274D8|nr:TIGR01777 family oxidoreductase [Acinetobacter rathckeae]MBF7687031.1 TIGR01777 family protein [Acinetobacter rathckeae]MBF7694565.1 TIGR01777 family protein [Acinetobacter rathckeae]
MQNLAQHTILITGGTGLIGTALIQYFLAQQCHIIVLTRSPEQVSAKYQNKAVTLVPHFNDISPNTTIDYVINLAGENISSQRWNEQRKQVLIQSRVNTTKQLTNWLDTQNIKPKCIISGSAVGYYGIDQTKTWQHVCNENSPPQNIFISEICQKWEKAILPWAIEQQQNLKIIRLGVVFSQHAPAFKQMLLPIKLNAVGNIGSGQQPLTWIHIEDVINAIVFLMTSRGKHQIYNLSAPQQTSQQQFVMACKSILHKHTPFSVPESLLKLVLKEQAELITNGQYVSPTHLSDDGYQFLYPTLDQALGHLLA